MPARMTYAALALLLAPTFAVAAPSAADALKLSPVQKGVEYDAPQGGDQAAACTIKSEKVGGVTAWVVRDGTGLVLRQFADTNVDNVVDQWRYFRGGLEVYRDVDVNFNGKADQYRWLHTAGSRTGLDKNEDGAIDAWTSISPEEAAEEAVLAVASRDGRRFERLLLTKSDVAELGLADEQAKKLLARIAAAPKTFAELAAEGKIVADAEFSDFGGLRPGAVPAGTNGLAHDLLVYEDAWAMVRSGKDHLQLRLGTMVNVGGGWKLIDGPTVGAGESDAGGFFFDVEGGAVPEAGVAATQTTEEMQTLLEDIEKLDNQLATADEAKRASLQAARADKLEKLASISSNQEDRQQWIKQLADMLSAAVQDGTYPDGMERLESLEEQLAADKASDEVQTHVQFCRMQAAYGRALSDPKAKPQEVEETWIKQLEDFVGAHKSGEQVAEALLQLGMFNEFRSQDKEAIAWYQRLVDDLPDSPRSAKARGALTRLQCVGKPLRIKGQALTGEQVDLASYRGKVVLLHYWTTSAQTCESDHKALSDLYKQYGRDKLEIVGVCLDRSRDEIAAYLKGQRLPWKQLYEPGGFDSRLANEMGVLTAPLFILADQKGLGVNANVQLAELEDAVKELLPSQVASKPRK